jgi:membrane protein DedA with SNARE-associated domain
MVGIGLLIAWIVFLRATFLAMGWLGIILDAAFFGCVVWLFVDQGWLSLEAENSMIWVILIILSLVLAVGMSWAHIRRRMSGQYSVDDVEDD